MTHVEKEYIDTKQQVIRRTVLLANLVSRDSLNDNIIRILRHELNELKQDVRRLDIYRLLNDIRTEKVYVVNEHGHIVPISFS